jgi:predicted nucleic acid-binding protein
MMNKAADINKYAFSNQDRLFFDANVWLYLYGPQGSPGDPVIRSYSAALARAVQAGSRIWVDVLVLSEFINRFARIEYDIYCTNLGQKPSFKHFRRDPAYPPVAQAIVAAVRNILKFAERTESGFTVVDMNALLTEFQTVPSDFNDQVLVALCITNGLYLVTHDSDFKGRGVNILSANPRLI